ncbi:MAG: uroporphyrinogen decarboxylase family protein [Armatimonadota bacterium]|nr:uroporphyrinogen decarboxylase family protein [Armatimonadota bacterium]
MTDRERILRTFEREPADRICWQPRLEHWFNYRRTTGTLPERYRGAELFDVYDDLGCSVRYAGRPLVFEYNRSSVSSEAIEGGRVTRYETPIGTLTELLHYGEEGTSAHRSKFPVETLDDMEVMEYFLSDERVRFDLEQFQAIEERLSHRGVCQFYFPRTPLMRLIINFVGFEPTIFLLQDEPERAERFMSHIERCDDQLFDVLCASPVRIINFGDNIDGWLTPPPLFERYLMPVYERRCEQLHAAGKFTHIHMDGALKPLLPYLSRLPQHGIEAPTPLPQGDVTPQELRDAMGEKILLDGIPCVNFLPEHTVAELEEMTLTLLDLFAPNVILGISDEISPPGEIERVRLVTEMVQDYAL